MKTAKEMNNKFWEWYAKKQFANLKRAKWLFISICLAVFWGCDQVDNPIPAKNKTASLIDTAALDKIGTNGYVKKVLLEDYTGHTCGNCPRAAEIAKALKTKYGSNLVVMAVHVGYFAEPQKDTLYNVDFRTSEGNTYDAFYGVSNQGLPQGMVNRAIASGQNQPVLPRTLWEAAIVNELSGLPAVGLKMAAIYKPDSRLLNVKVQSQILFNISAPLSMALYLLEDSLVGWQKDYSLRPRDDVRGYVFDHLLRQSLNGAWGEVLTSTATVVSDKPINRYYGLVIPTRYRANHLKLVAAVFETASKRVIQAEEIDIPADQP